MFHTFDKKENRMIAGRGQKSASMQNLVPKSADLEKAGKIALKVGVKVVKFLLTRRTD
jgi:hypothetical protein